MEEEADFSPLNTWQKFLPQNQKQGEKGKCKLNL